MMKQSDARTALVTGATKGIGREVARQLQRSGFEVFVTGRDRTALEELKNELHCGGAALDLSPAGAPVELFGQACRALGRVDVLVNNAGSNRAKEPLAKVTSKDLDESYALNVRAPILLAREALKQMAERRSGHILNVISSIVYARMENYSVYTTMKMALHGFTGCLIKEGRLVGVKVTGIYPGGVNTSFRATPRPDYLTAQSTASMIVQCILAPEDVVVHELAFRPMVETNF